MPTRTNTLQQQQSLTELGYRSDTIYEERDGFFIIEDGKRSWFDSAREAKQATGFDRVFTFMAFNRRN